jgi:hypothetical protein
MTPRKVEAIATKDEVQNLSLSKQIIDMKKNNIQSISAPPSPTDNGLVCATDTFPTEFRRACPGVPAPPYPLPPATPVAYAFIDTAAAVTSLRDLGREEPGREPGTPPPPDPPDATEGALDVAPNATCMDSFAELPAARFAPASVPTLIGSAGRVVVDTPDTGRDDGGRTGGCDDDGRDIDIDARGWAGTAPATSATPATASARCAELSATRISDVFLRSSARLSPTRRLSSSRWRMYSIVGWLDSSFRVAAST